MRARSLAIVAAAAGLAFAAAGNAGAATPRTQAVITGGQVVMIVDPELIHHLSADGAGLTASGGASLTVTKKEPKQTLLSFSVAKKRPDGAPASIELASHCRCVSVPLRGSIVLTGNGKRVVLGSPVITTGIYAGSNRIDAQVGGSTQNSFPLASVKLPRTLSGTALTLTGLVAQISSNSGYQYGFLQVAPNFPTARTTTFAVITVKLRLAAR